VTSTRSWRRRVLVGLVWLVVAAAMIALVTLLGEADAWWKWPIALGLGAAGGLVAEALAERVPR
jgi:fatty acid desaturase